MGRKGFNNCARCGKEYIIGINEGGTKYCGPCRYQARLDTNKRNRLIKPSDTDGREIRRKREIEYMYPWACGVCGMKRITEAGAQKCCQGTVNAGKPIYIEGGFWWNTGILKDIELEARLTLKQVPIAALANLRSRLKISSVLAVATSTSTMNSGVDSTSLQLCTTQSSKLGTSAGTKLEPSMHSGAGRMDDIALAAHGKDSYGDMPS